MASFSKIELRELSGRYGGKEYNRQEGEKS